MKVCSKCSTEKPETEYFLRDKKSGRLHAQCKDCYTVHRKTYYSEHYKRYRPLYQQRAKLYREKRRQDFQNNMLDYLSDKVCVLCGESDIRTFEFDHIDPKNKTFTISQATRHGYDWKMVEEEIRKCRILCANCHKKRTASQYGWYKNLEARTGIEPA